MNCLRRNLGFALSLLSGAGIIASCAPQAREGTTPDIDAVEAQSEIVNDAARLPASSSSNAARTPFESVSPSSNSEIASADFPDVNRSSNDEGGSEVDSAGLYVARAKAPVVVLGKLSRGRLSIVDACLIVTVDGGSPATAVLPPDARVVMRAGRPSAVSYAVRTIPIGQETRIPGGGGSVTLRNLAQPLPQRCPTTLFAIGG